MNETRETSFLFRTLATFGGAGYFPFAPGTAGSIAALPLAWLAAVSPFSGIAIAVILSALAIPSANAFSEAKGEIDPKEVVIDEAVGMTISCIGLGTNFYHIIAAFFFFRFFDVLKPTPCRQLEYLPGAWGILMDDVAAGIYSLASTYILFCLLPV